MQEALIKVLPEIQLIDDKSLRAKTLKAWEIALDAAGIQPEALRKIPFSLLATKSGISLADHIRAVTLSALGVANEMASAYGQRVSINRDLLVAGGLVHDIGKVLEYQEGAKGYTKTIYGNLLRHPFSGVWICAQAGLPVEVMHIVAVHSKEGEGGFRTIEATIVHHCDFANFEPFKD